MKKAHLISLFIGFSGFVGSNLLMAQESWQSQLVTQDKTGNLTYQKDKDGHPEKIIAYTINVTSQCEKEQHIRRLEARNRK